MQCFFENIVGPILPLKKYQYDVFIIQPGTLNNLNYQPELRRKGSSTVSANKLPRCDRLLGKVAPFGIGEQDVSESFGKSHKAARGDLRFRRNE